MADGRQSLLTGRFTSHGQRDPQTHVTLTEDCIAWANVNKKISTRVNLSDVLTARYSDGHQQSPPSATLAVHYIQHSHRKLNHEASLHKTTFNSSADVCIRWQNTVNELLRNKFPRRPKRLLVFINPISGKRSGPKVYRSTVEPIFTLCGITTDVIETQRAHQTEEILSTYDLTKVDGIVTVGGDGTYAEAASGLAKRMHVEKNIDCNNPDVELKPLALPIGIIPTGTGDGVVDAANTTKNVTTAAVVIVLGDRLSKDLTTVHHSNQLMAYSVLLTGAGLLADIIRKAESNRGMGRARYIYAMLYGVIKRRTIEAEVDYLPCDSAKTTPLENPGPGADCKSEDGWLHRSGEFIRVDNFLYQVATSTNRHRDTLGDGCIRFGIVRPCGRIANARYLKKSLTGDPEMANFSYAEEVMVSAYRVRPSGAWRENPLCRYINVDGEIVHLPAPDFSVKIHKAVSELFSWPLVSNSAIHPTRGATGGTERATPPAEGTNKPAEGVKAPIKRTSSTEEVSQVVTTPTEGIAGSATGGATTPTEGIAGSATDGATTPTEGIARSATPTEGIARSATGGATAPTEGVSRIAEDTKTLPEGATSTEGV